MLDKIFISKVRVKLLQLFLITDKGEHHVRELVRMTDEEINAVRRELKNLAEAGILTSVNKTNRVVYSVNPLCPIINELTSMFLKNSDLSKRILEMSQNFPELSVLILTHNYIDNKYETPLDIDLLVVGNPDVQLLSNQILAIEKDLKRQIRFTVMNNEDYEFRKKKRDSFLVNILQNKKVVLIGDEKQTVI